MPATSYISIRKSPSKPHRCRVRRKRQRLRSNGPIGSDPAFSLTSFLRLIAPGYSRLSPIVSEDLSPVNQPPHSGKQYRGN